MLLKIEKKKRINLEKRSECPLTNMPINEYIIESNIKKIVKYCMCEMINHKLAALRCSVQTRWVVTCLKHANRRGRTLRA